MIKSSENSDFEKNYRKMVDYLCFYGEFAENSLNFDKIK